jgi:hypothetical protein
VRISTNVAVLLATVVFGLSALRLAGSADSSIPDPASAPDDTPRYTSGGELIFPGRYRDWTFLTSGLDMSYANEVPAGSPHMFENVFVDPAAGKAFQQTGTWPDGTTLVIEFRDAAGAFSINKHGRVQTGVMGYLAHVKDAQRFPGKWRFFSFGTDGKPGSMIPTTAACYVCHSSHGAVDNTFVQFYPTLLPIATTKGTLSEGYLHDPTPAPQPSG